MKEKYNLLIVKVFIFIMILVVPYLGATKINVIVDPVVDQMHSFIRTYAVAIISLCRRIKSRFCPYYIGSSICAFQATIKIFGPKRSSQIFVVIIALLNHILKSLNVSVFLSYLNIIKAEI